MIGGCSRPQAATTVEAPQAQAQPPEPPIGSPAAAAAQLIPVILSQLREEASHRPGGTPTVEEVLRALNDGGVPCFPGRQSLAVLTKADYCWHTRTKDDAIAFSICEYTSTSAVERSQHISLTEFPSIGERTFLVQGNTMMTIKVHKPGGEVTIEKVKELLASLH